MKFEVGDLVKITEDCTTDYGLAKAGTLGVVTYILTETRTSVCLDEPHGAFWIFNTELELVARAAYAKRTGG